jgi:ribosomal protein S18 acetylase RimI-like enzyme
MIIRQANAPLPDEAEACNFSFEVTCEVAPPFEGSAVERIVPVAPYRKSYPIDAERYRAYIGRDDRALFVAWDEAKFIGYVAVARSWNNYAKIDDIAVDVSARRLGAGRLLLNAAIEWAHSRALLGVRLETQSNNVAACRFYERHGFTLGGFDRYIYRAIKTEIQETALFWYLIFPSTV